MSKTKKRSILLWGVFALLCAVSLALLELNKNTVAAWGATIALLIGYAFLRKKLRGKHFYLRLIAFLALAALLLSILLHVGRPYRFRPAVEKSGGMTGVVDLHDGKVQGVYTEDKAVEVYTGIPYAKPPVGELRWKAPQCEPAPSFRPWLCSQDPLKFTIPCLRSWASTTMRSRWTTTSATR